MLNKIILFGIIFFISFISPLGVEVSCPSKVYYEDNFSCGIEVSGSNSRHDLKFQILGDFGKTINRNWDGESWLRADWFLKDFLGVGGEKLKSKIHKDFKGEATLVIKLRNKKTKEIVFFEEKTLEVKFERKSSAKKRNSQKDPGVIIKLKSFPKKVINLKSPEILERNTEIIYESKTEKIGKYSFLLFSFFLIVILMYSFFR